MKKIKDLMEVAADMLDLLEQSEVPCPPGTKSFLLGVWRRTLLQAQEELGNINHALPATYDQPTVPPPLEDPINLIQF